MQGRTNKINDLMVNNMRKIKFTGDMFHCATCGESKPRRLFGKAVLNYQGGGSFRCKKCVSETKAPDLNAAEGIMSEAGGDMEFIKRGECQKCHNHDELTVVFVGRQEKELCAECAEQWEDLRTCRPKQAEQKRPMLSLEDREAFIGECARKLQDATTD